MTLTNSEMMLLMQWADGEADPESSARAEALVKKNADAQEFVRELGVVADSIRDVSQAPPSNVDITESVMSRIVAEQGAVVHSLAAERAKRRRTGGLVAGALAIAAAFVFVMRPHEDASNHPIAIVPAAPQPAAMASANANATPEVQVTGNGVSVFYVQDTQAAASSVIVFVPEESQP